MSSSLTEQLRSFARRPQPPAEIFGGALRDPSIRQVVAYCEESTREGAERYARVVGVAQKTRYEVLNGILPHHAAAEDVREGTVPLILESARNPTLKDRFFTDPDERVHHFVDHNYVPSELDEGLDLQTVGTTEHGLAQLNVRPAQPQNVRVAIADRQKGLHRELGPKAMTYVDFRRVLARAVGTVPIHALGPAGTNIEKAALLYSHTIPGSKAYVEVHPSGVEPMQYAGMASREATPGVVPLHMECAVYYDMARLREMRKGETTFADHQHMPLIPMLLATNLSEEELARESEIIVASHPSPLPLVHRLIEDGTLHHLKASSNSDAALKVDERLAQTCITTRAALREYGLREIFDFGSPNMIFTLGTPLSPEQLRSLRIND